MRAGGCGVSGALLDIPEPGTREWITRVPRIGPDRKDMTPLSELQPEYREKFRRVHESRIQMASLNRVKMLSKAAKSPSYQRLLLKMCERDALFWVNHFVFSCDPRLNDNPVIPLVLWPRQCEILRYLSGEFLTARGRQMSFIEKSRATGYSWVVIAAFPAWGWLFRPHFSAYIGAVLVEDVDDAGQAATLKSHFGRIRFILRHLPDWMLPPGMEQESFNKKLLLQHPQREGSRLTGRQFSSNFGRGDRATCALLDECAHSPDFDDALASVSQTTFRIVNGTTPKGRDTASARLRFSGLSMKVFQIHWPSNPSLDVDWYWEERRRLGPEKCASELDVSYDLSASNRVFKTFDPTLAVGDFDYDPSLPLHVTADPGFDDACALLWIQPDRQDGTYRIVDSYVASWQHGERLIPFFLGYVPSHTLQGQPWPYTYNADERAMIERHAKWGAIDEMYGDASGSARSQVSSYSLYDLWEAYGVARAFGGIVPVKHADKLEAIRRAEVSIARVRIAKRLDVQSRDPRSPSIVECFQQYEWAERESPTGREMKRQPKHNVFCHAMDAWQFYLAGKDEDVVDARAQPLPPDLRHLAAAIPDLTGTTGTYAPEMELDPISGGD